MHLVVHLLSRHSALSGAAPEAGIRAASASHPPALNMRTKKPAWKHYERNTLLRLGCLLSMTALVRLLQGL